MTGEFTYRPDSKKKTFTNRSEQLGHFIRVDVTRRVLVIQLKLGLSHTNNIQK